MSSSSFSIPFHQRLLDLERKFRQMRHQDSEKRRSRSLCMTSPLPRRPMPLALGKDLKAQDGSLPSDSHRQRRTTDWNNDVLLRAESSSIHSSGVAEDDHRLEEIMKLTGILRIGNETFRARPSDLDMLGELGHGTCGHVVKMRFRPTGDIIAVKQMCRSGNKEENKRIIMDLDVVLRSHECPFIVRCLGCFITDSEVWICMELMTTCLDKLIKRLKRGIPEAILGKMTVSVVKALHYLKEEHGIIHRDVKPSNMLLDWKGTIKLCDFGISGRLVDSKAKTRTAGCVAYMAPERVDPPDPFNADYDIRADVWSLGISLVELATGAFPYSNCSTDFELLSRIIQDAPPVVKTTDGFSPLFCDFVTRCLTKDHKQRPKYAQLMKHPFFVAYETATVDISVWLRNVLTPLNRDVGGVRASL
ncbi:dual specificity mitogen activated protein [Trichuris trichiura]|uniref:mitogen-activated protein kinase kinase n=1 Tax=Trichuris trichiura TaxID=36087 RepID=A0A077ZCP8_TRITR|nr:dual specificity mitogen activated protein [Trichuris trichiura]